MNCISTFDHLCDDLLLNIFKYVSVRDRVKFERLNRRVSAICLQLAAVQQCIAISTDLTVLCTLYDTISHSCDEAAHRLDQCDVIKLNDEQNQHMAPTVRRILSKFNAVKLLNIESKLLTDELVLDIFCTLNNLQHIAFNCYADPRDFSCLNAISKSHLKSLTCFKYRNGMFGNFPEFVANLSQIRYFNSNVNEHTMHQLLREHTIRKVLVASDTSNFSECRIAKHFPRLTNYNAGDHFECSTYSACNLSAIECLREVSLDTKTSRRVEDSFIEYLTSRGSQLEKLKFLDESHLLNCLVGRKARNLTSLEIYVDYLSYYCFQVNLRELRLHYTIERSLQQQLRNFEQMLAANRKLKMIALVHKRYFYDLMSYTQHDALIARYLTAISEFASHHPKRSMTVQVSCKDDKFAKSATLAANVRLIVKQL